jgi:pyruvate dehydrogenase complex dehydrogenase (E1) component
MKQSFLVLCLLLAACSSGTTSTGSSTGTSSSSSSSSASTTDASTSCPSYASEVAVILDNDCVSCHGPGGNESNKPLDSYASAAAYASQMKMEVSTGKMPQGKTMAAADESTLLAWINCGAPNN